MFLNFSVSDIFLLKGRNVLMLFERLLLLDCCCCCWSFRSLEEVRKLVEGLMRYYLDDWVGFLNLSSSFLADFLSNYMSLICEMGLVSLAVILLCPRRSLGGRLSSALLGMDLGMVYELMKGSRRI
jgi:hypothetical protein